jgi:hypothetical protein
MSERSDLIRSVLKTALKQSTTGARIVGQQSKKQIQIRNLTQRKITLYQKLGKEVEQLVIQGELSHPGIERALEHLAKVDEELSVLTNDTSIVETQPESD